MGRGCGEHSQEFRRLDLAHLRVFKGLSSRNPSFLCQFAGTLNSNVFRLLSSPSVGRMQRHLPPILLDPKPHHRENCSVCKWRMVAPCNVVSTGDGNHG